MDNQDETSFNSWAKFLNPYELRSNLLVASLFLTSYEILMASIVDQLREFYIDGFNQEGFIINPKYQTDILSRDRSRLRASLLWLRQMNVIDESDISLVDRIRDHRNDIAHELPRFVATYDSHINGDFIGSIYELVSKIDVWWIQEVEIPTSPDIVDPSRAEDTGILSSNMLFLKLMIRIATGDESDSEELYRKFVRLADKNCFRRPPA